MSIAPRSCVDSARLDASEVTARARLDALRAGAIDEEAEAIALLAAAVGGGLSVRRMGTRVELSYEISRPVRSPASSIPPLGEGTQDLLRLKEELSAAIAHDLRSPLAAVKGALDLLIAGAAGEVSQEQQRYLGIAERSSRHVLSLVSDLLDSSILDAGLARLDLEDIELGPFLSDVAAEYRVLADGKGIDFVVQAAPPLPPVRADRRRLHQILGNLLSNAVKFTDTGGRVGLAAGPCPGSGDAVALRVHDTGVGIPRARLPHLFDKLRRRESRGTRGERGTGLGLYICKRLIDLHGGTISVESETGCGTTFGVILPATRRSPG